MANLLKKTISGIEKFEATENASYLRGVDHSSGLGLILVFMAFFLNPEYLSGEFYDIKTTFWGILTLLVGFVQLNYHRVALRLVVSIFASALWFTLAGISLQVYGHLSIASAACIPLAVSNFYLFGFLYNEYLTKQ